MKKMRKIFAVLLTLAMVLGMSITSFAADPTAKITVSGLDTNATVTYKQIIRPNTQTATGWEFVDKADITAFGYKQADEQTVLWKLIKMVSKNTPVQNMPAGTVAFTTSEFQTAVGNITTTQTPGTTENVNTVNADDGKSKTISWDVTSAGVYVVNADSKNNNGESTAYTYSPMAAYISFGGYDTTTGVPSSLEAANITAKSTTVDITKSDSETDKVVEVGKTVTYDVTTKMPFVSATNNIRSFKLIDTIDGAEYVKYNNPDNENDPNNGKVHVTGTIGTTTFDQYVDIVKDKNDKDTITIDLSEYLENNAHANQTVNLSYDATVTSLEVNNSVIPADGKNNYRPAEDRLYTGTVTLTKTGKSNEKLKDAKFVLKRTDKEEYAIVSKNNADNTYSVTGWTSSLATAKASGLMVTDNDGKIVVKGLDDSKTYEFKEIEAPKGYSINETNSTVSWDTEGAGKDAATRTGSASMVDSKLSALPSTGGIGTTIFTIAGCVIMIAAAGLFFASRKKSDNK